MMTSILHFSLPCILPYGHTLAAHTKLFQLSQLASGRRGPRLVKVVSLSEPELRVLLPLLAAYPACCSYEEIVLAGLAADATDDLTLKRYHLRLEEAKDELLAPVRSLLSTLNRRRGLRRLNMRVLVVQDVGYYLSPLVVKGLKIVRPDSTEREVLREEPAVEKARQERTALNVVR